MGAHRDVLMAGQLLDRPERAAGDGESATERVPVVVPSVVLDPDTFTRQHLGESAQCH